MNLLKNGFYSRTLNPSHTMYFISIASTEINNNVIDHVFLIVLYTGELFLKFRSIYFRHKYPKTSISLNDERFHLKLLTVIYKKKKCQKKF